MIKFYPVFLVLFHRNVAYHHGVPSSHSSDDNGFALPQDNHLKFMKFENFENVARFGRQIPSGGFDWDSESIDQNGFNTDRRRTNNWNSESDDPNDSFIFEDDFENRNFIPRTTQRTTNWRRRPSTPRTPTSTMAVPGMGTPRTPCEDRCLSTPEYNPVCGDDGMTYFSNQRLFCAQKCGKRVKLMHLGACTRRRG